MSTHSVDLCVVLRIYLAREVRAIWSTRKSVIGAFRVLHPQLTPLGSTGEEWGKRVEGLLRSGAKVSSAQASWNGHVLRDMATAGLQDLRTPPEEIEKVLNSLFE